MADAININNVPVASVVNDTDYLHLTAGNTHNRVLVSTLIEKAKAEALTATEAALLDKLTDGCFIMYHKLGNIFPYGNGYPYALPASSWTSAQNSGEIADGVLVVCGDKHIVVAPTGAPTALYWGSTAALVATSGNYSDDRIWAMARFDGKARTAAILASSAYSGDGAEYAPGFCHAYSRANANGHGLTAGRWWLPSAGELMLIWSNKQKINILLSLITGAEQLAGISYWSSSEYSNYNAWRLNLDNGFLDYTGPKNMVNHQVRPVSAFYW